MDVVVALLVRLTVTVMKSLGAKTLMVEWLGFGMESVYP